MAHKNFTIDVDADGIALVTWNMPGRTMNVIDASTTEELSAVVACAPFSAIVARVWIELAKQPVQA